MNANHLHIRGCHPRLYGGYHPRFYGRILGGLFGLVALVALTGCQPFDHYDRTLDGPVPPAIEPPRELAKVSLPAYRVEPPDVLQLEVLKLVPLPPYHLEPFDTLQISVLGALAEQPIYGYYLIDAEGRVDLGPGYGLIRVAGMTIDQARQAVDAHLRQFLKLPEVSVQLARPSSVQLVSGYYLIGADGTINLRQYGAVYVSGKTLPEARLAIERQLAQFFDSPKVALDITSYNSKVYYIVTEGAGQGDNIVRIPVTGNETVLDAITQVHGLSQLSSKRIWIARPAPHGFYCEQILPVDYVAITKGASTATNYQIMPGDRVFISEDDQLALATFLNKLLSPAERLMGFGSLTASTIRNFKFIGSNTGVGGFGF